jgi:ribosomal protein L29
MNEMNEMNETTDMQGKIINRHIARLLTNLEQANCPDVFVAAVKSELTWLRSDLRELSEKESNESLQN